MWLYAFIGGVLAVNSTSVLGWTQPAASEGVTFLLLSFVVLPLALLWGRHVWHFCA